MFPCKIYRIGFTVIMMIVVLSAMSSVCQAAQYTWTGGGDQSNWYDTANWTPPGTISSADDYIIPTSKSVTISSFPIMVKSITIQSGASLIISGVSASLTAVSAIIDGQLRVDGGTVTVSSGGAAISSTGNITISDGTITSYGITNSGNILITGGTIISSGSMVNNGTGTNGINMSGGTISVYDLLPAKLENNGVINWSGGIIQSGGTGPFTMNNAGTITIGGVVNLDRCYFTNAGTLDASNTLSFLTGGSFNNYGIIKGRGTIDILSLTSDLVNGTNGKINPGLGELTAANLTIKGTLVQSGGILQFSSFSSDYDRLTVQSADLSNGNIVIGDPANTTTSVPTGTFSLITATAVINYSPTPAPQIRSGYTATVLSTTGSNSFQVNVAGNPKTFTWKGTNSNAWNDSGNWDPNGVPGSLDSVIIPGSVTSGNWPVIEDYTSAGIASLTIEQRTDSIGAVVPDRSLSIGNVSGYATLTISGLLSNNGTIVVKPQSILNVNGSFINGDSASATRPAAIDIQSSAQLNVTGTDLQNKQYGLIRGRGYINITPTTAYPSASFINGGRVEPGALYLESPLPTTSPPYFFGGTLTINGEFKQDSGTLLIDVKPIGETDSNLYNYLTVNGKAYFGGNLIFRYKDYVPADIYDVVQTSSGNLNPSSWVAIQNIPGATQELLPAAGTAKNTLRINVPCSTYRWSGASSNEWTDSANWAGTPASYPNSSSVSVFIPANTSAMPQINSSIDICGITMEDGTSLNVNSGGTLTIHKGGYYMNSGITVDGALNILGGNHYFKPDFAFSGSGRLTFGKTGSSDYPTMYAKGNLNINVPLSWIGGVVEPEGTDNFTMTIAKNSEIIGSVGSDVFKKLHGMDLVVPSGSVLSLKDGIFYLGNKANFKIDGGILSVDGVMSVYNYDSDSLLTGTVVNNGTIVGIGTLNFATSDPDYPVPVVFTNNGTISPGLYNISNGISDIGTLTIQHPNSISVGTLAIQINSAATGGYDVLSILGTAALGGTLNVTKDPNYSPNSTDYFDVLRYSVARSGIFTSVTQPWYAGYEDTEKVVRLKTYTLNVSVSPSGSGSVSVSGGTVPGSSCSSSCTYTFPTNSQISLYATPASGYRFSSWSGVSSSSSYPQEAFVTMDGNKSVMANFASDSSYPNDPYYPPDNCPNDPNKTEPGICGCGIADTDKDSDGTADCKDQCPEDPKKTAPGICGCGVADTDSDEDGVKDCKDLCPKDPKKAEPGICGCGIADTDRDSDGTADCKDQCPDDPKKTEPGKCGCGIPDTEYCGKCPPGSLKTEPGICGCNVPDTDTDKDGTPDCIDKCPEDPKKTEPGKCGCGKPETENCGDSCPDDPNKTEPGICGCGIPDTDSDKDGTADCKDKCPNDPNKTEPGICGCGISDKDSDGDGIIDCRDGCPNDPKKTASGICGCGISDEDSDGDGVIDCVITEPPQAPTLLNPKYLEVISKLPQFQASPFVAGGNQYHLETYWLVQRTDHLYLPNRDELFDQITVRSGTVTDMTSYLFNDAAPGLKYSFKAGYKGSGSNRIAWSQISSFIVGTLQSIVPAEVKPGSEIREYQMISFPYWTQTEKLEDLLKNLIGEYDRKMFRIGAYDPVKGGYVEYGEGIPVEPGKAFWFLSRNGINISFDGVPVSLNHAIDVRYDQGWNMIAPPNHADYDWTKIEVLVFDNTGKIVYQGLSGDKESQEYVDGSLWQWDGSEDDYAPTTLLEKGRGCWIRVKKPNVVLRFSENARLSSTVVRKVREQMLRFAESLFTPKQAVATTDEKPPMPMGNTGFSIESERVDAGGGCFIDTAAKDVF